MSKDQIHELAELSQKTKDKPMKVFHPLIFFIRSNLKNMFLSFASIKGEVWCFGVKVLVLCLNELSLTTVRRHDTQHNDIQRNDTH